MTWLGSADHCGLLYAAIVLCARLALGPWAARPHYHLVSHRKLRAASPERASTRTTAWQPSRAFWYHAWLTEHQAVPAACTGGAADTDSEQPRPAPGSPATLPGAGLERRTVDEPRAEDGPAEGPQLPPTAAGPQHRATTAHTVQAHPTGCGGPAQRSVDVDAPDDSASTGYQPRNSGDRMGHESGVPDPLAGTPVRSVA